MTETIGKCISAAIYLPKNSLYSVYDQRKVWIDLHPKVQYEFAICNTNKFLTNLMNSPQE
jgi:hypothetical protein